MKRIGIDGRAFYGSLAGTGQYVTELCRVLDAALPDADFYVYANRPLQLPVVSSRWHLSSESSRFWRRWPASLWFFFRSGQLASRDGVDVFWGCANFLPLRLVTRIKTVLTVYDLVFLLFPQTMGLKHRLAYSLFFRKSLQVQDKLVVISEGTAARLLDHYGWTADLVVRPAVRDTLLPPTADTVASTLERLGLHRGYFLSVSTLEPRKNLESVLLALLNLARTGQYPNLCLVLVGQKGWLNQKLDQLVREARKAGLQIIELGYVPDQDLPSLYAGARAVLMPSLYEGFGMPILEAVQCGGRVLTSDTPETREAGGDQARYVQPDVAGIQAGLVSLLAEEMIPLGRPVPQPSWTWASEGQRLADLIRSLW